MTSGTQSLRGGAVLMDGEIQVLVLPSGVEEVVIVNEHLMSPYPVWANIPIFRDRGTCPGLQQASGIARRGHRKSAPQPMLSLLPYPASSKAWKLLGSGR